MGDPNRFANADDGAECGDQVKHQEKIADGKGFMTEPDLSAGKIKAGWFTPSEPHLKETDSLPVGSGVFLDATVADCRAAT